MTCLPCVTAGSLLCKRKKILLCVVSCGRGGGGQDGTVRRFQSTQQQEESGQVNNIIQFIAEKRWLILLIVLRKQCLDWKSTGKLKYCIPRVQKANFNEQFLRREGLNEGIRVYTTDHALSNKLCLFSNWNLSMQNKTILQKQCFDILSCFVLRYS